MLITVFRSRLKDGVRDEYGAAVDRMNELARTMPGYISRKAYTAEDGEKLTIVEFESEETHRAWAEHPSHRAAQKIGREKFYAEYSIRICKELRSNAFKNAG